MSRPGVPADRVFTGALLGALVCAVLIHVGLGYGLLWVESDIVTLRLPEQFRYVRPAPLQARGAHGPVAFEPRRLEEDCTSIPECEVSVEPQVIELKIAKLGSVEQDPEKLPEIQKYEVPEKVEEGVNVTEEVQKAEPIPFKDFLKRKAELDRKRRKRNRPKNLFNLNDDDPRARPTAFERIVGRKDGDVMGFGSEQERFDTYQGHMAHELHKAFFVPTSMTAEEIKRNAVAILVRRIGSDGSILEYQIRRRARSKAFTSAAEAAVKAFVPEEGGRLRLKPPDADVMTKINARGIIVELDGRLFR